MSKIFLITYDLKEPGQDYSELYEAIKGGQRISLVGKLSFKRIA